MLDTSGDLWYVGPMEIIRRYGTRRNARLVNPDGTVLCAKCNKWKHIKEFNQASPTRYVTVETEDGIILETYGRPTSYCKACVVTANQERALVAKQKEVAAKLAVYAEADNFLQHAFDSDVD